MSDHGSTALAVTYIGYMELKLQPIWDCQCQIAFFFQSRELEISVNWKDYRNMCAVKFLRLEDFLDAKQDGMIIHLEPQGILFAEVSPIAIHDIKH